MTALIIDTTGAQAFIGLAENGLLLSKIVISEGRQLSKFLLPSIQSILQAQTLFTSSARNSAERDTPDAESAAEDIAGSTLTPCEVRAADSADGVVAAGRKLVQDVNRGQARMPNFIAIGTGPGSFTGSRVGGIVAQSLSYGWNIPLISLSSTLLPDLDAIAALSHEKYLLGEGSTQIELVYISSTP